MSKFSVPIKRIRQIEPHPNADAIEFAVIDGYRSIVKKGEFQAGDLIAYIPEASLLPQWLLKKLNFWNAEKGVGRLNGKDGNRITAIKLRGELSQGVCYPVRMDGDTAVIEHGVADSDQMQSSPVEEGQCVAELLGVQKYEPPIPTSMAGDIFNAGQRLTVHFDVENWKSYPDILQDGEEVVFTEKLHGTFTGVAILPEKDARPEAFGVKRNVLIFSKGLGAKGLVLANTDGNSANVYVRATTGMVAVIDALLASGELRVEDEPLFILGETFGPGVQDLAYGKELGFRLFALASGYRGAQRYHDFDELQAMAEQLGVQTAPVLYRGPFSQEVMQAFTDGATELDADHIREGIVMTPTKERRDPELGRVCLKSVSAAYLCRKGGTEFS
ncbi:RNA ligase (ATP) [Hahella sp. NBU794]|uniref:RNA ligase (ATP) n=1 Tax=Hahella sp. NBU794 TaxID=3422590 RepID=UPI003D6F7ECD